jgi:CheY-like chemotaxis protein
MDGVIAPILVVDDHDDARRVVTERLAIAGYSTVPLANGKEALDYLVSDPRRVPRLIVLDLEMPIMSGWEFLGIVKSYQRLASIPVLIVSIRDAKREALIHGAVIDHLQKPCDLNTLVEKISQHVGPPGA